MEHILCLADIHGNVKAVKTLKKAFKVPFEFLLCAGDLLATTIFPLMVRYIGSHMSLSRRGYANWVYNGAGRRTFERYQLITGRKILTELQSIGKRIIIVPGNVDCRNVLSILQKEFQNSLRVLDGNSISLDSFTISGIGGALPYLSKTGLCDGEISEKDFKRKITFLKHKEFPSDQLNILLTHEAPAIPKLADITVLPQCGSKELAKIIPNSCFRLIISGHYHERPGFIQIDNTIFLNPGALARYRFSVITVHRSQINVRLFQLPPPISDFTNFIYSLLEREVIQ